MDSGTLRSTTFALAFLPLVSTWASPTIEKAQIECRDTPEYQTQTVLIVFDRTTPQSDEAKQQWKEAVSAIFANQNVGGRIRTMEVRDSDVNYRMTPPLCTEVRRPAAPMEPRPSESLYASARSWLASWFEDPKSEDAAAEDDLVQSASRLAARANIQKKVLGLLDADDPTHPSAILVPLFKTIRSECAARRLCRVYIFSDLNDTAVRDRLRQNFGSAAAIAERDYSANMNEFGVKVDRTELHILAWGGGRDEVNSKKSQQADERRALGVYWRTMFGHLCSGAAKGSTLSITPTYPVSEGTGCSM
jgi:hypothetical protein